MAGQSNITLTAKCRKANSSMYLEYGNLIKELEQYMPQFKITIKDLQEPSQSFVTGFYTDALSEFFCDVNNLTEVIYYMFFTLRICNGYLKFLLYLCKF